MKNAIVAGQPGIFIPYEEFKKGLWLDEDKRTRFEKAVIEQRKLIKELKANEQKA